VPAMGLLMPPTTQKFLDRGLKIYYVYHKAEYIVEEILQILVKK